MNRESQEIQESQERDVFKLNDFWFYMDSLPAEGLNLLENIEIITKVIEEKEDNIQKLAMELQIIKLAKEHLVNNMMILSEEFEKADID